MIRLRLPQDEAPAGVSYRARLSSPEGRELFAVEGLTVASESDGTFVDVIVPGGLLPHGTYILVLARVDPDGSQDLGSYTFSVRSR